MLAKMLQERAVSGTCTLVHTKRESVVNKSALIHIDLQLCLLRVRSQ